MLRLHGLAYHPDKLVAQAVQIRLVAQLRGKRLQGLGGIVPLAVEPPVYKVLDAPAQRIEKCCDRQGGAHDSKLRKGFLAGKPLENCLGRRDDAEIEQRERDGERAVDEGAVDEAVDVVEPVAQ